jgi:type II secretory pathway predicted ATPase ExeA
VDWSHFGLTRPAFRAAVDTDSYFPAAAHEAGLAAVAAGFARRDPVVLIDGPSGVGKSLVARKWLEGLLPEVPRAVVPNVHAAKPAELLQAILFDLSKPYQGLCEQELRLAVTGHLLEAADASGYPTVLLIDEAQHLTQPALEELRLLGNVETRHGVALFALLVAHPMLRDALARPAYEAFAQRVTVRAGIEPLTAEEAAAYLRHQVAAAGGDPAAVLDDSAVSLLAAACGGIPRVLNQAAALAATLAIEAEAEQIDVEAALEALGRLGIETAGTEESEEPVVLPHPASVGDSEPAAGSKPGTAPASGNRLEPAAARGSKQKTARKRSA